MESYIEEDLCIKLCGEPLKVSDSVIEALRWTGAGYELMIEMVGYLSKWALRTSIADYVEGENADGQGVTWNGVRAHTTAVFFNEDEAEYKRRGADNIRQLPYQDNQEYAINFQTAVHRILPTGTCS